MASYAVGLVVPSIVISLLLKLLRDLEATGAGSATAEKRRVIPVVHRLVVTKEEVAADGKESGREHYPSDRYKEHITKTPSRVATHRQVKSI